MRPLGGLMLTTALAMSAPFLVAARVDSPTAVIIDATVAIVVILILVALPILWWVILALTGRIGSRRR